MLTLTLLGIWGLTNPALAKVLSLRDETYPTPPPDITPPEIYGVRDFLLYQGDTVSYLTGVSAWDEEDPAPEITVDSSQVDLSRPGTYLVTYWARDAAGNLGSAEATVTVLEKKTGYVELEAIEGLADTLLAQILGQETNPEKQVRAIYVWARSTIRYAGHSDRADWRQTAYQTIQSGEGDCYGFFAVCKLFFTRLQIPNLDVVKVKNSEEDSNHFWSLVSVDGGKSYYHFDATPRAGEGDDFCLVTDAFLDTYSREHKNCHNRDTSLYPATPKEDLA